MAETRVIQGILGDVEWRRCADSGWWRARFPTIQSVDENQALQR